MDEVYERGLLGKDQPAATVLMADFLDGHPDEPTITITEDTSKANSREMRWHHQHWKRAKSSMLNVFNQSLANVFLSGFPVSVSRRRPCGIWKDLEQKYGVEDAGGVIELRRHWERIITANWGSLGALFAQPKQQRNDINRKMTVLVSKEIVTEHWLCMEVLAQLPSEFLGSTISLTEEWFTIENVEISLRRVFGDRSKKEINMLTKQQDKRRPVAVNVAKKQTRRKRTQDESINANAGSCYYCFEEGYRTKDGEVMGKDHNPRRPGGALFRSNIRTAPGAKKKRLMTVKKGVASTTKNMTGSQIKERTPAEALNFDHQLAKAIEDADEFEFQQYFPASDGSEREEPTDLKEIDDEGLDML